MLNCCLWPDVVLVLPITASAAGGLLACSLSRRLEGDDDGSSGTQGAEAKKSRAKRRRADQKRRDKVRRRDEKKKEEKKKEAAVQAKQTKPASAPTSKHAEQHSAAGASAVGAAKSPKGSKSLRNAKSPKSPKSSKSPKSPTGATARPPSGSAGGKEGPGTGKLTRKKKSAGVER